ncbi:alpha/beta fold hydrolase [Variovorax sp. GB1P17]|uniref:alpha/beta fold hydrolase n=1 Tax=Variovorax sp. GB1P17 TaxID=3443740 RepID=UPI003F4821B6
MTTFIESSCLGRPLRYRALQATTPDGLTIAVQDWNKGGQGQDVLFLHGFSQAHLAWLKQVTGPLAEEFRFVTYDNRGHGLSAKPQAPEAYRDSELWADEVHTVIEKAGLQRPVLVAWSYAGRIVMDYLRKYGDKGISGLVMVAATSTSDPATLGLSAGALRRMGSDDLATSLEATCELLQSCVTSPLPADEFAVMMGYNAMTPPSVRAALVGRPADYDEVLRRLSVPVLTIHGDADRVNLPTMSEHTCSLAPQHTQRVYAGVGHLPFWEDATRFDTDLAQFLRALP